MVATVSVTSCLDDNDGDDYEYVPLTKMEQLSQLIAMEGNYSGKSYIFSLSGGKAKDSIDVAWTVVDSTLTIKNFPIKLLASVVASQDYKDAFENSDQTQELKCTIRPYRPYGYDANQNATTYWYTTEVGDENQIDFNIMHEGENVKTRMAFVASVTTSGGLISSYGGYSTAQKRMELYLLPTSLAVGDAKWNINSVYFFGGNK